MIKSFLVHNDWFNDDIIIITDDLEELEKKELNEIYSKIIFKKAKNISLKGDFSDQMEKSFIKFQVFDIVYDRIVFIDSDCLILKNIKELFEVSSKFSACPELSLNLFPQFNTGVMVINPPFHNSDFFYNHYLNSSGFKTHGDQTVLNEVIKEYNPLDISFNTLKILYRHNGSWFNRTKILHYVSKKPWEWMKPYHMSGNRETIFIEDKWFEFYVGQFEPEVLQSREHLLQYIKSLGAKYTAEIGVFEGEFSKKILDTICPTLHYAVDPWIEQVDYQDYANTQIPNAFNKAMEKLWNKYDNCKIVRDFSKNSAKSIKDSSLDFVYLDAKHDKKSVKEDIEVWWPKIKSGGILAGHDYMDGTIFINGVKTVFGVKSAVDDFATKNNLKVRHTLEEMFRTWWIVK